MHTGQAKDTQTVMSKHTNQNHVCVVNELKRMHVTVMGTVEGRSSVPEQARVHAHEHPITGHTPTTRREVDPGMSLCMIDFGLCRLQVNR